ncbi:MAG TPA: hypothetical protein VN451_03550 [Chitinophagaceae bacterium]|nr:hypothetical protein [Chitinophagaceae bacterium]
MSSRITALQSSTPLSNILTRAAGYGGCIPANLEADISPDSIGISLVKQAWPQRRGAGSSGTQY